MLVMHRGLTEWDKPEQWHKCAFKQNLNLTSRC